MLFLNKINWYILVTSIKLSIPFHLHASAIFLYKCHPTSTAAANAWKIELWGRYKGTFYAKVLWNIHLVLHSQFKFHYPTLQPSLFSLLSIVLSLSVCILCLAQIFYINILRLYSLLSSLLAFIRVVFQLLLQSIPTTSLNIETTW